MDLAPIGLTVYSRLAHVKLCIDALKNNILAKESNLYIFSDGPKEGDEDVTKVMREYIKSIDGFKKVEIIERIENSRVKNNRGGQKYLLNKYGRMIWLAEDIVTAPGFLQYINAGLDIYEDNEKILSVGGHTPCLKSLNRNINDVYFTRRFHPWGCGFWKTKYSLINKIPEYHEIESDKQLIEKFHQVGTDLLPMLKKESEGKLNALDLRSCYLMNKMDMYMALPTQTLVKNIGLDGSGLHCGDYDPYSNDELSKKIEFNFPKNIYFDNRVIREYKSFYDQPTFFEKILNKLKGHFMK